jgi:membrane fusion protein (multidrug efflux system)
MPRIMVALAALLLVAAAVAALVFGPSLLPDIRAQPAVAGAKAAARAVPVRVEPVLMRAEQVNVQAVGTASARQAVILHPAAAGQVVAVNFRAGERVEADEVLVELDRRAEQLRLAEAERALNRFEGMGKSGAVAAADLDAARTAVRLAALEVQAAEVALADRIVRAPFTGHIGITEVDPGDRINLDTGIAPLDDRSVLLVSFEIPELFLKRLRVGDEITVATWAAGETQAEGEIYHIGTRVDPERRTFTVRARVNNAEDRLRPGMSFRVNLQLKGRQYPLVPEVSLQWGDEGSYVWVVGDGGARRVPVTIVQRREGRILVDGALGADMRVITEGVQSVRKGVPINIVGDAPGTET